MPDLPLSPCPFCGKAMMLRGALWPAEGDRDAVIHAEPTDCPLYDFANDTFDGSIVEVWNRRAPSPSPAPGAVEALPRPDAVSMASGTICLEYVDRDERDRAFDWLEAHGAGAALTASHMPVRDGQKYRLLEAGEIIASDDEFIGDDGITWERVKGWPVGFAYTHIFKSCRRPLAAARAGEDGK